MASGVFSPNDARSSVASSITGWADFGELDFRTDKERIVELQQRRSLFSRSGLQRHSSRLNREVRIKGRLRTDALQPCFDRLPDLGRAFDQANDNAGVCIDHLSPHASRSSRICASISSADRKSLGLAKEIENRDARPPAYRGSAGDRRSVLRGLPRRGSARSEMNCFSAIFP